MTKKKSSEIFTLKMDIFPEIGPRKNFLVPPKFGARSPPMTKPHAPTNLHVNANLHAHTHKHTHTCTHAHTRKSRPTCTCDTRTHIPTHIHTYIHTYTHTYTHTHTHLRKHTDTHSHTHTHVSLLLRARMRTCKHSILHIPAQTQHRPHESRCLIAF